MMRMSSTPLATASSTTYWMAGLSTTGSISFGCALVAGRNRVPSPAAGMTAFLTFTRPSSPPTSGGRGDQCIPRPPREEAATLGVVAEQEEVAEVLGVGIRSLQAGRHGDAIALR